jgi:predicted phosphodiesterase
MRRPVHLLLPLAAVALAQAPRAEIDLPLKPKSTRFAVIGDTGSGHSSQYEVGKRMAASRERFPFEFVIMLGDNLYGGKTAADFRRKFEEPYKALLDAGVKFYASLGNHDSPDERFYKPFNMDGKRYYSFRNGAVEFFALDSTYMDPQQLDWVRASLKGSRAAWKICFFHHPLYSDGRFHGSDTDLRRRLEPLFMEYGVDAVFSGHDHVYQRLKPQNGIYYFVAGSGGRLRAHGLARTERTEKGFDTDHCFLLVEIAGDALYLRAVSRTGQVVDSAMLRKNARRPSS